MSRYKIEHPDLNTSGLTIPLPPNAQEKSAATAARQSLSLCLSSYLGVGVLIWNISAVASLGSQQITLLLCTWRSLKYQTWSEISFMRFFFFMLEHKPKSRVPSESKQSLTRLLKTEYDENNDIQNEHNVIPHQLKSFKVTYFASLPLWPVQLPFLSSTRYRRILSDLSQAVECDWTSSSYLTAIMKKTSFGACKPYLLEQIKHG